MGRASRKRTRESRQAREGAAVALNSLCRGVSAHFITNLVKNMSYLVLARKFRPQTFSSIVGQKHISTALANAIIRGRVPHALLFTGPRGVGKTTSARVFARALNCTGRELPAEADVAENTRAAVEPCGDCANCREIAKSSSMAVWEIDGASNNSVDNVRDLIDSLRSLPPPGSEYKIYIIDEVHMLSVAAFNALLKSLEEPPPNTIFVFATTEPHKIPETVISRCQRHDFRRIPIEVIAERLREIAELEKLEVEEGVTYFLARRAQGGMRDAQSMFDRLIAFSEDKITLAEAQRVFGALDQSYFFRLSEAVFAQDPAGCFDLLDEAFDQSIDLRAFIGDFIAHWRNLLLIAVGGAATKDERLFQRSLEVTAEQLGQLREQVKDVSSFDMQRLFDLAEQCAQRAVQSSFPRFVLEAGLAKMAALTSLRPLPELIDKLERLGASGRMISAASVASAAEAASPVASPVVSPVVSPARRAAVPAASMLPAESAALKPAVVEPAQPKQSGNFNPSWQAFIAHVKSRREPMLETFLKRVSPKQFNAGQLVVEASKFDSEAIGEGEQLKSLRDCLHSYSGREEWLIRFEEPNGDSDSNGTGSATVAPGKTQPIPGSIAADEAKKNRDRRRRIEKEARSDPLVQSALETFEGSEIEKVAILPTTR